MIRVAISARLLRHQGAKEGRIDCTNSSNQVNEGFYDLLFFDFNENILPK